MIKIDYKDADNLSSALDNLYTIITLLRSPEGCPWDRIQTNKTATQSLIDESYEYLDGVIKGNVDSFAYFDNVKKGTKSSLFDKLFK